MFNFVKFFCDVNNIKKKIFSYFPFHEVNYSLYNVFAKQFNINSMEVGLK